MLPILLLICNNIIVVMLTKMNKFHELAQNRLHIMSTCGNIRSVKSIDI